MCGLGSGCAALVVVVRSWWWLRGLDGGCMVSVVVLGMEVVVVEKKRKKRRVKLEMFGGTRAILSNFGTMFNNPLLFFRFMKEYAHSSRKCTNFVYKIRK